MPSKEHPHSKGKSSTPNPAMQNAAPEEQALDRLGGAMQGARSAPQALTPAAVLHLQRTLGNQAVGHMVAQAIQRQPVQRKANTTGLPDTLKAGIENLSGYSMDDVRVHYNSDRPAQVQALAYTQGTEIHVASGQEKHLPHEAWHVVQQKQGRVQPTMQIEDQLNIKPDPALLKEAEVMGARAMSAAPVAADEGPAAQRSRAAAHASAPAAQRQVVQRVMIAGVKVLNSGMPTWEQDGERYHINVTTATFHVTKERSPKTQYFYQGSGQDITDKQPTKEERGKNSKVFSKLPKDVQAFVRANYQAILAVVNQPIQSF